MLVPGITAIEPARGPVGTLITITGRNFGTTPAANIVRFGSAQSNVTSSSTTNIVTVVPSGLGTGAGAVTVTVAGQSSNAVNFSVIAAGPTAQTMNFPILRSTADLSTGFGLVNLGTDRTVLTLTAYGNGGDTIKGTGVNNPVNVVLEPLQQTAKLGPEFFNFSSLTAPALPLTIAASGQQTATVRFRPSAAGICLAHVRYFYK